jgi:sugar lactone lactonase YvrE
VYGRKNSLVSALHSRVIRSKNMRRILEAFLLGTLLLLGCLPTCAQILDFTNEPGELLEQLDTSTGMVTPLHFIGARPDSLILNSLGQIIYSVPQLGYVALFDPVTGINTILASGLGRPRDLVFDPNGSSMLIGVHSPGKIVRYSFLTGTTTTLAGHLGAVDGLAYDPQGHLFAVVAHYKVCQFDPNTGQLLKTLVLEPQFSTNGGDGMTYDPYSGQLWISHIGTQGNGLIEVPTDLSGSIWFQTGKIPFPDGIVSDGNGNLYIASWKVVVYNIPTDTITKSIPTKEADDVALVPGTY